MKKIFYLLFIMIYFDISAIKWGKYEEKWQEVELLYHPERNLNYHRLYSDKLTAPKILTFQYVYDNFNFQDRILYHSKQFFIKSGKQSVSFLFGVMFTKYNQRFREFVTEKISLS